MTDQPMQPPTDMDRRSIWAGGSAMIIVSLLLLWQYSFLAHAYQLVDLWKISERGATGFVVFLLAVTVMTLAWIWSARRAIGVTWHEARIPLALATIALLAVFVFVYPATAIDVYIYAARSHLFSDYGLNPSTALPESLWDIDPYVRYASQEWATRPSPYGPLWNGIAAPMTALDGDDIRTAVLLFKVLMAGSVVAVGWLVYDVGRKLQPRLALPAALLWLWSPIVLWEGVANAHNDVTLALLLVGAVWGWYHRHDGVILPLLAAAALLKVVAVMLIPAAIAAIVVRNGLNRRLWATGAQSALLSLAVVWVAFIPYFDIRGTIDAIQSQRGVWVTSPVVLFEAMNDTWGWGLDPRPVFDPLSTGLITVITVTGAVVAWQRPNAFPRIAFEQLFWFLLLATSNLRPWYAIWILALAVALPLGMPLMRAVALSSGMLLSYGYSGWIQNWTAPEWVVRNAINLGIMLGPVLIVLAWEAAHLVAARWRRPDSDVQPAP